ncbi:MAG: acyltransferase [Clostridiales bacterium]|nr:acyltransferase [Clostridiales bacterium]
MRRFWAVPVLAFLVYFLSGVFPILMAYKDLASLAYYIEMSLHNMQPFFMGAHLLVPVITAVLLYRYLQNVSSVAVMHSMPFTRSKLFNSGFVSGLILITVPILLNGIILLLLSKPTYRQWGYAENLTISTVNVFSTGEILNWIGTSVLIVLVLFSVAVFTGIVTGNNLMHLLTSYFFIFLIPLLYAVFNFYFQEFLYGFDLSGNWMDICLSISPYTGVLQGGGYFGTIEVLYYIGTILIMLVVSAILYNKRKLERASDSLTFGFMKPILCYIIAFLGMTMLGFYFQVLGEEKLYMYAGFAAGTVIFFIIGQMIVTKSARIFNREGLRYFLVYVLVAVLFLVGLNADITGFEKRVPDPQKINSAGFEAYFNSVMWRSGNSRGEALLTTPENLEALTEFHRSILDNRERFEQAQGNQFTSSLQLEYDMKGLPDMNRRYIIDYGFWADSPEMKRIFESAEYKSKNSLYSVKADTYTRAYLYSEISSDRDMEIRDARLVEELVSCMEKDFRAMSYEDLVSLRPSYVSIEIQYTYTEEGVLGGTGNTGHMSFQVPLSGENTINWLKAQGYDFHLTADMVERIDIYAPRSEDDRYPESVAVQGTKDMDYRGSLPMMQIEDKVKIEKILQNYQTSSIDYNNSYEIRIQYKPIMDSSGATEYDTRSDYYIHGYLNQGLDFLN